ncbi:MAG: hypothetical protein AAF481_11985 [Acidobacteriota bacterium]
MKDASGKRRGQLDSTALDRLPLHPGMCAECRFLEIQASKRSAFARCGRSDFDDRFRRYPPLPVYRCAGFEQAAAPPPQGDPQRSE